MAEVIALLYQKICYRGVCYKSVPLYSVPSSCTLCQPVLIASTSDEKYRFGVPFEVLVDEVRLPQPLWVVSVLSGSTLFSFQGAHKTPSGILRTTSNLKHTHTVYVHLRAYQQQHQKLVSHSHGYDVSRIELTLTLFVSGVMLTTLGLR